MSHPIIEIIGRLTALAAGCGLFIIAILGVSKSDFSVVLGLVFGPIFLVYAIGGNAVFQKLGKLSRLGDRWP